MHSLERRICVQVALRNVWICKACQLFFPQIFTRPTDRYEGSDACRPSDSQRGGVASVPLADLSSLLRDILLLIVVGQEGGERILHESTSVPHLTRRS